MYIGRGVFRVVLSCDHGLVGGHNSDPHAMSTAVCAPPQPHITNAYRAETCCRSRAIPESLTVGCDKTDYGVY